MQDVKTQLGKFLALIYGFFRPQDRVAIYNATSTLLTGILALLTAKVTNFHSDNDLVVLILGFLLLVVGATINTAQARLVELGTKELAKDGNEKVGTEAQLKIEKNKKLLETVKKNQ